MSDSILRFELRDQVALLRFDDGKANAISHAAIDALERALERAEKEAGAVALLGRPGRFSAGFDLSVMTAGPEAARALVGAGGQLLARLVESPLPVVAGCTGHALAMGALLLLGADLRVGSRGDFRIGLNEVAIRMTLPRFAIELVEERISRRHRLRAATMAEIYGPEDAVDAGYLDRVAAPEELEGVLLEEAGRLAELPGRAFAETKQRQRGLVAERIRAGLDADLASFVVR